jgi:hypothetical protein
MTTSVGAPRQSQKGIDSDIHSESVHYIPGAPRQSQNDIDSESVWTMTVEHKDVAKAI